MTGLPNFNSQSFAWCWGKTDRDGISTAACGPAWNPLIAHLLDTAAVTLELWDRYLPAPVRERLAEGFGGGDGPTGRSVVGLLSGLHDLGKAAPTFLGKFGGGHTATHRMREERTHWEEQARAAGLPLPESWAGAPWARHEHITARTLPGVIGCRCPGTADGTECREHRGLHVAATCLGGHHGHVPTPSEVKGASAATGGPAWDQVRARLAETVAEQLGLRLDQLLQLVNPERPATLVLFTGLVVLADWIASDTHRFPYAVPTDEPAELWHRAQGRAREAVGALGLDRWRPKQADWERIWPGTEPRPFQTDAMRLLPDRGQALVMVESDTGSGKTRLALWCAHHLAMRNGYQGVYLAMPTRAATHQVALEVEKFLPGAVDSDTANMALVHATASASDLVHRLVDAARVPKKGTAGPGAEDLLAPLQDVLTTTESHDSCDCQAPDEAGAPARAVLDPWYLRRCLGLVATFGIGTVDQLVLAAQPSRHWFLRTFGLACKTVVIDEAHAYELYQQHLLGAAVEWLADAGASVVVLSATLPASVRTSLTRSWCTGLRTSPQDCGDHGPITVIDGTGVIRRGGPRPDEVRALRTLIELEEDPGPGALAARLLGQARDGGCVGVVRTRVDSALALYEEAQVQAAQQDWDASEILLLHGRKLPRDRQPLEERLSALLGPADDSASRSAGQPNPDRPDRLLVIATQVIEQSLDLDFDHVVSDLAPIDLLIQRRGRLHRHAVNDPNRPLWCTEGAAARMPVLYHPDLEASGLPLVEPRPTTGGPGNTDGLVYSPYTLAATYRTLAARRREDGGIPVATPRDSPELLESVYGARHAAEGAWGALMDRTWRAWQDSLAIEKAEAKHRARRPYEGARQVPADVWKLSSGRDHGQGDDGGFPGLRALSRLGDPSISVLCLYRHADRLTYDAAGTLPVTLGARAGTTDRRNQEREILLNTLAVPARWFRGSNALPHPETWPTPHPLLGRTRVALFDEKGACVSGPAGRVHYDPVTGLSRR